MNLSVVLNPAQISRQGVQKRCGCVAGQYGTLYCPERDDRLERGSRIARGRGDGAGGIRTPAGNAVKHFQAVEFRWSC